MALNIVKKLKNKIKVASGSDLNELCEEVVKEVEESALILSIDERCEAFDYLILSAVKFYKGCDDCKRSTKPIYPP